MTFFVFICKTIELDTTIFLTLTIVTVADISVAAITIVSKGMTIINFEVQAELYSTNFLQEQKFDMPIYDPKEFSQSANSWQGSPSHSSMS